MGGLDGGGPDGCDMTLVGADGDAGLLNGGEVELAHCYNDMVPKPSLGTRKEQMGVKESINWYAASPLN